LAEILTLHERIDLLVVLLSHVADRLIALTIKNILVLLILGRVDSVSAGILLWLGLHLHLVNLLLGIIVSAKFLKEAYLFAWSLMSLLLLLGMLRWLVLWLRGRGALLFLELVLSQL
jgi:hypothetical protein